MTPAPWTTLSLLAFTVVGCGKTAPLQRTQRTEASELRAETPSSAPHAVRWYGALRSIMHEGKTQATVRLTEVVPGPHAWGLGALEGLHGEATVLDDVVWLARPNEDGTSEVRRGQLDGADAAQGAALFVVAIVDSWTDVVVQNEVPWSQLDAFIEAELTAHGASLDAPVAIRVEGPIAMLKWHVVNGSKLLPGAGHAEHARTAVRGIVERADARLIGFFSTSHQGVFTHAGSRSHFHVLVESTHVSGHVDGFALRPGARLLIATR